MNCRWLPELCNYPDWSNYDIYENDLYELFKDIYINKLLYYDGQKVNLRRHPECNGKHESFYHLTCKEYSSDVSDRDPDPERMIRMPWARAIIENKNCDDKCCVEMPLYWSSLKKGAIKHHMLFQRYLVIVEERTNYYLLITGFYCEDDFYHKGKLKEYLRYKKAESAT